MKVRSIFLVVLSFWALSAYASAINVDLGTADSFAVLGQPATNIHGNVGVWPGSAITGFGTVSLSGGTTHAADAVVKQAQSDLTTAYNFAVGSQPRPPILVVREREANIGVEIAELKGETQ